MDKTDKRVKKADSAGEENVDATSPGLSIGERMAPHDYVEGVHKSEMWEFQSQLHIDEPCLRALQKAFTELDRVVKSGRREQQNLQLLSMLKAALRPRIR